MICIDKQTVNLVLTALEEKYKNAPKDTVSQFEDQVKDVFPESEMANIGKDILSNLEIQIAEPGSVFFDYDGFVKTICALMPEPQVGGDNDVVEYERPVYFSFSSKDLKMDILVIGNFLIALTVLYLGISRIDKFNEQIIKNELNLEISYTDLVSFQALWERIKGHNFCETIAYNLVNKAITIGLGTTEQALQNCWTFNPTSNSITFALSVIETWAARDTTMSCITDYANLEYQKMKIDLKHKAKGLPLGFFFLWFGITMSGSCIGYLAYRLGFQKVVGRIKQNLDEMQPSMVAGRRSNSRKSKKSRKYKKNTKKNRRTRNNSKK